MIWELYKAKKLGYTDDWYYTLLGRKLGGGASYIIETLTGVVPPITIADAIKSKILSLIQYGKCVQNGTPTPTVPVDIKCNNGALKLGAVGKNLFNTTIEQGSIASATGEEVASNARCRSRYIPVKPNTTYTISAVIDGYTSGTSRGIYVYEYTADSYYTSSWQDPSGVTFTTHEDTLTVRFVFGRTQTGAVTPSEISNVQLELGSSATSYEPYRAGLVIDGTPEVITLGEQTAHAENLFQVGGYEDTQNIISGLVTRQNGIKVFDGTEDGWGDSGNNVFSTGRNMIPDRLASKVRILCTHFRYSESASSAIQNGYFGAANSTPNVYFRYDSVANLEEWRAWLAAQYAQGTPVIVVYSLAEPIEESVTAQHLSLGAGSNTMSVTAEVSNIAFDVEYKKSAE